MAQARPAKGNEAGVKYYLMGVFATGVLLYGMSLLYGVAAAPALRHRRGAGHGRVGAGDQPGRGVRGGRVRLQGVGRALPHLGARHEAPTPVTAFCGVVKAAGFVALLQLVVIGFAEQAEVAPAGGPWPCCR